MFKPNIARWEVALAENEVKLADKVEQLRKDDPEFNRLILRSLYLEDWIAKHKDGGNGNT